ncbi:MAG: bifunctional precorrin-2 dehydrogenase/sirohydrochlorin ferrochelatase [Nitrospiraceae bacterium]|nr:bifunctional precorrin-2 dehydrogenase/sirohydrochlorin ferrochelatase [Nitrospiraceae bacterium]
MNYYPAFLNLKSRKAVVVGGGKVAERKVSALLKAGADVTVISPSITPGLQKELSRKRIMHLSRTYRRGDLRGAFLAIAATDSPETNRRVSKDAPALVNVVDVPTECNFIAPSVVRRGPLLLAVSTSGTSPAFARTLRKELEKSYGPELSEYLKLVKKLRVRAMTAIPEKDKREAFLKGLASGEMLKALRTKGAGAVKDIVLGRLKRLTAPR